MRIEENTEAIITLSMDCLTVEGDIKSIIVVHSMKVCDLIALGHYLQKDLYNQLKEELDNKFENNDSLMGYMGMYSDVVFKKLPSIQTNYIHIENNSIIPEFQINKGKSWI